MNEFHKLWLAALRSGQYGQGKGYLRREKRFCCIGVGCDVINPSGWKQAVERSDMFDFEGKSGQPPDVFMEKTGFSIEFCSALMGLNDTLRFSFEQIADYVEGKINNGTAFRENK